MEFRGWNICCECGEVLSYDEHKQHKHEGVKMAFWSSSEIDEIATKEEVKNFINGLEEQYEKMEEKINRSGEGPKRFMERMRKIRGGL
ncbi:MAG: hypothetical protein ABSH06_17855 [Thermodesulfobacteriota bacterium]